MCGLSTRSNIICIGNLIIMHRVNNAVVFNSVSTINTFVIVTLVCDFVVVLGLRGKFDNYANKYLK